MELYNSAKSGILAINKNLRIKRIIEVSFRVVSSNEYLTLNYGIMRL